MTETISTTKTFDMPVDEIIEMALQGVGGEHVSHHEARLARSALNLVFIDLQNRGMAPLASMELKEVALVSGSSEGYELPEGVFNILEGVIEVSTSSEQTDLGLSRISMTDWLNISTKNKSGRPSQFMVDKQRDSIKINVWPKPDANNFTFKAWCLTRISDVTKSYQLADIPHRYLPAIIKGLRFHMSDLRGSDLNERMYLKQEYYETLQNALDEDRERVGLHFYPYNKGQLGS